MKTTQFTDDDFFSQDVVKIQSCQTNKPYVENDYEGNLREKESLLEAYKNLPADQKKNFKDIRHYFKTSNFQDLTHLRRIINILWKK